MRARICRQIPNQSAWLNWIFHNQKGLDAVVMVWFSSFFYSWTEKPIQVQVKARVTGGASLLLPAIFAEYYAIMPPPNCRVYD